MRQFTGAKLPKNHNTPSLINQGKSNEELSLYRLLQTLLPNTKIISGDRTAIYPRELDIYIPSKQLAIEFNGLFWHYENSDSNKTESYHLYKTIQCNEKNIRLLSIFSDELEQKKRLVIDLIKKSVGIYQEINIDDCVVYPITQSESNAFLKANHLLGSVDGNIRYGLFYNNELVFVALFNDNNDSYELLRYSELTGFIIRNALSKIIEKLDKKKIICEIDRRLYDGVELKECGFVCVSATKPEYTLTKDFKSRINPTLLTESQAKNYKKVWDCGKLRFELE